jgi:O-antigen ligase
VGSANLATDASAWIDRQWDDFLAPTTDAGPSGARRLTSARGTRSDLYRVAFDGFETHPLRGDGAGGFEPRWFRTREVDEQVRDAHSLGLQTLGELGAVGGLLLATFLVSVGLAVARARRRRVGLAGTQAAAVGAALVVWVVHAAVDWDWQVPAFTGTVLVLAAAAHPAGRARRRATSRMRPRHAGAPEPDRELVAA